MATTYSTNSELTLLNGIAIDDTESGFFKSGLTSGQRTTLMDAARLKAYNFINDGYLVNRTVIPASHISSLKQIEIDLVFAFMIRDSYVQQDYNQSEWQSKYEESIKLLENIQFDASNEDPVADSENVGNGTLTVFGLNDDYTQTETWVFTANSATQFSVYGTASGDIQTLTVDTKYPEKDWTTLNRDYGFNTVKSMRWIEFPFYIIINSGTIPFVQNDKFTLKTYGSTEQFARVEQIGRA
jgi:hypothetical protein